jgi:hypothetical protein
LRRISARDCLAVRADLRAVQAEKAAIAALTVAMMMVTTSAPMTFVRLRQPDVASIQ